MKRLIVFAMAILAVGCKCDKKHCDAAPPVAAAKIPKVLISNENRTFTDIPGCDAKSSTLFINTKLMSDDVIREWFSPYDMNLRLICDPKITPTPAAHYLCVSLQSFKTSLSQYNWLKNNNNYIDFKKSYASIESSHTVASDLQVYTDLDSSPKKAAMTFGALENELLGVSDSYNKYFKVNFDETANPMTVSISLVEEYKGGSEVIYSIPFLKSILSQHSTSRVDRKFIFSKTDDTIGIIVVNPNDGDRVVKIYDYSNVPGQAKTKDSQNNLF